MKNTITALIVAGIAMSMPVHANAAGECGSVTMAEWNWPSGELMANVDKFILETGYGCEVEMVPGSPQTTFASMDAKGKPDIAGELWVNALREPLAKALEAGRVHTTVSQPITGQGEGWWISPKTAEKHPELKTVLDVIEHPELFPYAEDPSKGAFYTCPAGWGCQLANANLFRAFNMEEKGWVLVDPGSQAGLEGAMAKTVERDQNWFGYFWSPSAPIAKFSMISVPFGVPFAGQENWDGCIAKPVAECADPKPTAYIETGVKTVVTDNFFKAGGPAIEYLNSRVFPGEVMNAMLIFMQKEQAAGSDAALEFLRKYESVWSKWVSTEVAGKVKSSL